MFLASNPLLTLAAVSAATIATAMPLPSMRSSGSVVFMSESSALTPKASLAAVGTISPSAASGMACR
ncbi:hypothetical protein EDE12_109165 [Methylosinus sp. sav-2]|nr:hypothetical protein EDE12_109165 [Methylosinus sp. sav-2]